MKNVKLLGIGCSKHRLFRKRLEDLFNNHFEGVEILDITDVDQIIELDVYEIPALIVNGNVLVEGEPPCDTKLQHLLSAHLD